MAMKVKLSDILEALGFQSDEIRYYLDKTTGRVHALTSEVARRLEQGDDENLIGLPTQWDIDEYEIMSDFCDSLPDGTVRDALYIAIQGAGAFRRFKDAVNTFGVADDWYKYRAEQFKAIAIDWCQTHDLACIDDTKK